MEFFTSSEPSLLLDIIVGVVFLCWAVLAGERGLYRSLVPLIVTVIAVAGAAGLSAVLRDTVTESVYPWAWEQLSRRIDLSTIRTDRLEEGLSQLEKLLPDSVLNTAEELGVDLKDLAEGLREERPGEKVSRLMEDTAEAAFRPVVAGAVRWGLFLLFFLILKLALGALAGAAGLAFRLPVIGWIDKLGGALIGILECAVVVWLLCRLAEVLDLELVLGFAGRSRILSLFFRK